MLRGTVGSMAKRSRERVGPETGEENSLTPAVPTSRARLKWFVSGAKGSLHEATRKPTLMFSTAERLMAAIALGVVVLDQSTKWLVMHLLPLGREVVVLEGFF